MLMRPACFGKICRPEHSSHSARAKQLASWPQRTGFPFSSAQTLKGIHGKAHDALPFPELACTEEQKQAGTARVPEGEQEGVGDF